MNRSHSMPVLEETSSEQLGEDSDPYAYQDDWGPGAGAKVNDNFKVRAWPANMHTRAVRCITWPRRRCAFAPLWLCGLLVLVLALEALSGALRVRASSARTACV